MIRLLIVMGSLAVLALVLAPHAAEAEVIIDWVIVGDPRNQDDHDYGFVKYVYRIGKYEVTNAQYREFLGAMAAIGDPNGLYNPLMGEMFGGIQRGGSGTPADPYVYQAKGGDANWDAKPVNYVSWYDCLRFANWLHNGQPSGQPDDATTEDGAYDMSRHWQVQRKSGARVFLPDVDEWYKAAYYKGGGTDAGYWDYATQSDTPPTSEPPPGTDLINGSANYSGPGSAVGGPYYFNDAGAYTWSESAYRTFDQNGNVDEWNDSYPPDPRETTPRPMQGGSYVSRAPFLRAGEPLWYVPGNEYPYIGFRVAAIIPEPGTLALLAMGGMSALLCGAWSVRRRRSPFGN